MSNDNTPILVIDLKKNRLRIYKRTLHLLGDPKYVKFLVNPQNMHIVVIPSRPVDTASQKVNWKQIGDNKCCEFYSKNLIQSLHNLCCQMTQDQTFRIFGKLYQMDDERLARFKMNDLILVNNIKEEDEEPIRVTV